MVKFIGDLAIDYGPTNSNSARSHPPIVYKAVDFPKDFFKPKPHYKRKTRLDPDWVDPMIEKEEKKKNRKPHTTMPPLVSKW